MGNDLFKIQRLAGCGINLPRWSNFSILSLQIRDHLLPLSFFSLSSFFFFLSISPSSPPLLELHGARNFAGNSELSRNRCSTKTRKKYRCPRRIVGRSVSSSFSYFFFLFFFTPTTPFRRYLSRRWMEGSLKVEPIVSAMQINTCAQYNSRRGNSKTMYK